MKPFLKMSGREMIAHIQGYTIFTDEELKDWSEEDIQFYNRQIDRCCETACATAAAIIITIGSFFAVWLASLL